MSNLLKELKKVSEELDKIVEEETGCKTFTDLLDLDHEVFEKEVDKVMDRLKEIIEDEKDEKEEKLTKRAKEIADLKAKKGIKEKATGTMFKVYETSNNDGEGVCVEARGKLQDILHFASKGMGEIVRANGFTMDDLDDLVSAFRSTIKRELLKEEK